ncbi:alpha/beta fold hydrolase [Mucilaginibacter gilvus]|nr:alpha/beta hydrolase [Mucilaginibacter gilvus]
MKKLNLLYLFAACTLLFACGDPQRENKHNNNTVRAHIKNNNISIAYTDTGKGDTTLLFVHGWAINKSYWADQVVYFGKRYRVVAMDMGGFGESGTNRSKWDTWTLASDVNAVIDQLKLKNVVLIGHSMAGGVVLQAAINQPDKVIAIVGVDNFKGVGSPPMSANDKKDFVTAINAMKHNFKKITLEWFNHQLFSKTTPKDIKDRILNDVAHTDTVVAVATQEQGIYEETPNLVKLKKKLYLVNSDYQPTDTTGFVRNKIPFMLTQVHGTGHFPMVEAPKEFNTQLEKVLADIKR